MNTPTGKVMAEARRHGLTLTPLAAEALAHAALNHTDDRITTEIAIAYTDEAAAGGSADRDQATENGVAEVHRYLWDRARHKRHLPVRMPRVTVTSHPHGTTDIPAPHRLVSGQLDTRHSATEREGAPWTQEPA